jgi:hypothetical protein
MRGGHHSSYQQLALQHGQHLAVAAAEVVNPPETCTHLLSTRCAATSSSQRVWRRLTSKRQVTRHRLKTQSEP